MSVPNVSSPTLEAAVDAGCVSQETAAGLSAGPQWNLGISPDDITTEKVTLAIALLDDSASMESQRTIVINAVNSHLIAALKKQQTRNDILFAVVSMWHGVLIPFTKIQDVEELPSTLYRTDGNKTPLYRSIRDALRMGTDKQGELALASIPARLCFLAYSDGGENVNDVSVAEVKKIVMDIDERKQNAIHGIACGSDAGGALRVVGFKRICDASNPLDLADAFNQFSRATTAAS